MVQPSRTHPLKLILNRSKSVFGVIVGSADQVQEFTMKLWRGGGDDLKVGEQSAVGELPGDFMEQGALALVIHMMDGEPGDHHIE
jgi:hypothetical protein